MRALAPWIRGYRPEWLGPDVLAGVSVAAVAIPIAIAYSKLAGVPPVYGLYASLLPPIAYALLGTSRQLILAPDSATCAIVAAVVLPLAGGDLGRTVTLTAALAMITGVFCIVAGLARLGFLTNFLARPILVGYLNGIALSIIVGQLGSLCGFALARGGIFRQLWQFGSSLGMSHGPTVGLGLTTLALLFLLGRIAPKAPGPLVAVTLGIVASQVFGFAGYGIALVGAIPAGLPTPWIPPITAADWSPLAMGALGLALISYNSAMVTARGFAVKNHYDLDSNREFIALGVANIGAGLLRGYAVSGADSRTAVNDAMGGKTQLTGLVAAGVIALTLLFLTGALETLPVVVLAAVLIKAAAGLIDVKSLKALRRVSLPEFRVSLLTLLGVVTLGVLPGVVIAIGCAMLLLLYRTASPHDAVLGRVADSGEFHDVARTAGAQPLPGLLLYRLDAPLLFINADHFKARVRAVIAEAPTLPRFFVLVAESMPLVDTTGAATLAETCDELAAAGVTLAVAGAHAPVRAILDRTGFTERIGADRIYPTLAQAVATLSVESERS